MKKYLLIILLLTTFLVRGQTPGTGFVTVTPANGKFNPTTGQFANYFGSAYGWLWYVSQNQLKAKLDSITSANSTLFSGKKDKSDSTTGAGYYTNYKALSKINATEKGQQGGVATLDANGKVPLTQVNSALLGSVRYVSLYDAYTNTPAIPAADSINKGSYYIVSVAGTRFGLVFNEFDWIISNGISWGKVQTTAYSMDYEYIITTSGVTTYTIPFPLSSKSHVYYNGYLLRGSIWSGVGTSSITLNADIRVNDLLKISN
jgi:hypothetical protein